MADSPKHAWVVRPVDDREPAAPFVVWSSEDGRIFAELGACYELVKPTRIVRWEEDPHPVIGELRSNPGVWAILYEEGNYPEGWPETKTACLRHQRVEVETLVSDRRIIGARARWIPGEEWVRIQGAKLAAKEAKGA